MRNFFHIQSCLVAWEVEDKNKMNFCLIFSIFSLILSKSWKNCKKYLSSQFKMYQTL